MKLFRLTMIIILIFLFSMITFANENPSLYKGFNLGVSLSGGIRYDVVTRNPMTGIGNETGPDFEPGALVFEYRYGKNFGLGGNFPVLGPILYGAVFKTFQFAPELTFNIHFPITTLVEVLVVPALGLSFHSGTAVHPPYFGFETNETFFSMGPRGSLLGGVQVNLPKNFAFIVGARVFGEYLLASPKVPRKEVRGKVLGAALDLEFRYKFKN